MTLLCYRVLCCFLHSLATITFFQKFARFVVSTIALSLFWSLALMMAMLLIFGPEGNLGSLTPLFKKCTACLPKLRSQEADDTDKLDDGEERGTQESPVSADSG